MITKLTKITVMLMLMLSARGAIADESAADPAGKPTLTSQAVTAEPAATEANSAVQGSFGQTETLILTDLFSQAYANNPQIQSAHAQWQAAVEIHPQAKSWPDPSTQFKWWPGSNSYEAELMQMVPNPAKTGLQGNLALSKADIARLSYERTVRDVLVDIMRSYYELGYLNRAGRIAQANSDLFAQIVDQANLDFSRGTLGASEKATAESRLAQSGYELQLLQEQLFSEQANMRSLLGLPVDAVIGDAYLPYAEPMKLDLEHLRDQVTAHRQELAMAGISVDAAKTSVNLAHANGVPDFSIGLMYESMNSTPMGTDDMGDPLPSVRENDLAIMFGFTIPIWSGKNNARIAQAKTELESIKADQARQTNQAMATTDKLYYQIQNLSRLVILYRDTLIPQATQAADLAQTWYESGQNEFTDLVESRLVLENFQLAGARAQADYRIALAELQRLIGAPIDDIGNTSSKSEEASK